MTYCEGCHLLIAPHDPCRVLRETGVWHTYCLPRRSREVAEQLPPPQLEAAQEAVCDAT